MFVKKNKSRNGRIILTLTHGYFEEGKVKHRNVETFGYLDELEKQYEDPITHFKEIAKQKTLEYNEENYIEMKFSKKDVIDKDVCNRKNLGYSIIQKLYYELQLDTFLKSKNKKINSKFNLNDIFKLLIYSRILNPSSKKNTFDNKDIYFEKFDFSLDDVYRSLNYFNNYKDEIVKLLNEQITNIYGRRKDLGYYDVTNYYFEIPYNDEDEIDDKGNIINKGFRKKGPSKEHRPDPIVQMGLLMDDNGIPITFNTFSGGESEKTSLLPTIRQVKADNNLDRIIVVADRGLNTSDNTFFLSGKNDDDHIKDGYVFGQSVLGADEEFKQFVLNQEGYIVDIEKDKDDNIVIFKHKSRIFGKTITIKRDGMRNTKVVIYQKQMVYYSEKYAAKQKKERDLVIIKAKDLIANPGKYTKATSVGAAEYINNIAFDKKTGVIFDKDLSLDLSKITEQEKYDGYYSIVTSEKNLSDKDIRDIYKGLWEIEESFKIIKSEFKARPIFLKLKEHIDAHFLICFVSLVIFRLLEIKLNKKYTVKEIRNSLINYCCSYIAENYFLFDYRDACLEDLEKIFNVDFSKKVMKLSQIKKYL